MEEKKQQISATPKTYEQGYTEGWDAAIKAYRQPGAVWVKASEFKKQQNIHYCGRTKTPQGVIYATIYWNHKWERFVNFSIEGSVEFEILDESATAVAGREESVQINREWINNALVEFALAYHRSTNKDIANDAAEYLDDKLKEAGVVYVLSVDESPAAGREEDAVAFGEWLRTFDLLDKQNGHWVLESQVATTRLYKLFKQQKER